MQLQLATICDSAVDYQGKLCVLGAFDTLCAHKFPVVHPQCSLALRLLFDYQERGRHDMSIRLISEEGADLMPAYTQAMDVNFPSGLVPFVTWIKVLNLQGLTFEKPGVYRFHITLGNELLTSIPLRVTRFEELRGASGAAG